MKQRSKRSVIWKMADDEFAKIVSSASSVGDVLRAFGLKNQGGNNNTVYRRIIENGLWRGKFKKGINSNKGRTFDAKNRRIQYQDLFCKESQHTRSVVKKRILKDKMIEYLCSECRSDGTWKGKPISLVLDHINGINNDHRLENLRFLCPNCNSQTGTFADRNTKVRIRESRFEP